MENTLQSSNMEFSKFPLTEFLKLQGVADNNVNEDIMKVEFYIPSV
jgi:hypothetical protein